MLVEIGQRIGAVTTVGIIVVTGLVGAALARHQGMATLARLTADLGEGRLPAEPLIDGVMILLAGAMLITPGLLTDLCGFLLLVPACRRFVKRVLKRRFERAVQAGTARVSVGFHDTVDPAGWPPMKNVTPRRPNDPGR